MAYYAKLENNIVQTVIVVFDDIDNAAAWCTERFGGEWVQTFDDDPNKTYANIGYTYDADLNIFIAPQPYPSWTLDSNHDWQPPTPIPLDFSVDKPYSWNEAELEWVE